MWVTAFRSRCLPQSSSDFAYTETVRIWLDLPDDVVGQLAEEGRDLSRTALEALAIDGITELTRERTPGVVREWIASKPEWLHIQSPKHGLEAVRQRLGPGAGGNRACGGTVSRRTAHGRTRRLPRRRMP